MAFTGHPVGTFMWAGRNRPIILILEPLKGIIVCEGTYDDDRKYEVGHVFDHLGSGLIPCDDVTLSEKLTDEQWAFALGKLLVNA
jgi:hypothetical protein